MPNTAGTSSKNFYTYQYWDDAKQLTIKTQASNESAPGWAPGASQLSYDVNGFLTDANDVAGNRTLHYTNSATGLVVRRDETSAGKTHQHFYYYAAGKRIGDVATDPNDKYRKSYAEELAIDLKNQPSTKDRFKNFAPVTSADFDQNYEPINANYPAATASSYTVRAGDILASIAQSLWGDSSMWYMLADANALKSTDSLVAGRVLVVPNKVTNIHNNANTFRPYNAGEMIGHVDPTLPAPPPPPGGGCGGLGQILMVVVVIVATIYTAGAAAAAGAFGSSAAASAAAAGGIAAGAGAGTLGATLAAGAAVMGGAAGLGVAVAASALGAAVGSAAGQLVGMATGDVQSFSWKAVGQSALAAGVTAGLGSGLSLSPQATIGSNGWSTGESLLRGAALATASTGTNMVLHGTWSWRQIGANLVGSMAGAAAGSAVGSALGNVAAAQTSQFAQRLAAGFAGGWASSEVMAGHNGFTRADSSVLFASAMGGAIGSGIADGPTQGATQGLGPWSDGDYRNGSDIQSDDAPIQRQLAAGGNASWDDAPQPSMADLYAQVYGGEVSQTADKSGVRQASRVSPGSMESIRQPNGTYRVEIRGVNSTGDVDMAPTKANAIRFGLQGPDGQTDGVWASPVTPSHVVGTPLPPLDAAQPSGDARFFADGRESVNSYWSGVQDIAVASGSSLTYLAACGMKALGNVGYNLAETAMAVNDSPGDALWGARNGLGNFGPEAFNAGINLTKTSLNGLSLLAETTGLAAEGYFSGFRDTNSYNITPLFANGNQAQAGGSLIFNLAAGKALAEFGNYNLGIDASLGTLGAGRLPITLTAPGVSLAKGVENVATFEGVNAARDSARQLSRIGDDAVDFVQEIGPMKGQVTGRMSSDGLQGWRVDFDDAKAFHINWWDRTGGPKRNEWLYGANKIEGGTLDQYQQFLQHFPKK